jgi:hypothetical protein
MFPGSLLIDAIKVLNSLFHRVPHLIRHIGTPCFQECCGAPLAWHRHEAKDMVKNNFPDCLSRSILSAE